MAKERGAARPQEVQIGKELAKAPGGAYLRRVTDSDRVRTVDSLVGWARHLPGPSCDGPWPARIKSGRVAGPSEGSPL